MTVELENYDFKNDEILSQKYDFKSLNVNISQNLIIKITKNVFLSHIYDCNIFNLVCHNFNF